MSMIMSTMSMIKESGRDCLIIVDELGRGTSPTEGVGIAHALAERIISNKVCRVVLHCPLTVSARSPVFGLVILLFCNALQRAGDYAWTLSQRCRTSFGDGGKPLNACQCLERKAKTASRLIPTWTITRLHFITESLRGHLHTPTTVPSLFSSCPRTRSLSSPKFASSCRARVGQNCQAPSACSGDCESCISRA